jgi:nicotinate phosphoribosyltransferase
LTYLRQTGRFSEAFLASLATWHFQGDVVALPEGSVFFCNEPVLEVTAPIVDTQLVESFIVSAIHLASALSVFLPGRGRISRALPTSTSTTSTRT